MEDRIDPENKDQTVIRAVVLAGGKSSRMGTEKAFLHFTGNAAGNQGALNADQAAVPHETFLSHILSEIPFREKYISVRPGAALREDYRSFGLPFIEDEIPDCGPMGGIVSVLHRTGEGYLLVLSCDTPFVTADLLNYLAGYISSDYDAFVFRTRDGRVHPLCGIYSDRCLPVFERFLKDGNFRMTAALKELRVKEIPLAYSIFPDELLKNINTPEELQKISCGISEGMQYGTGNPAKRNKAEVSESWRSGKVSVLAVCGIKNSGKTTFLEKLIPELKNRGLRIAVIKHDGHDFTPDVPGTDSFRLREAGAYGTAVFSKHRTLLYKEREDADFRKMTEMFPEADIVLIEGGKNTVYPKLEIVRKGISGSPVSDPVKLIGICTDLKPEERGQFPAGIPVLPLNSAETAAERILKLYPQFTSNS